MYLEIAQPVGEACLVTLISRALSSELDLWKQTVENLQNMLVDIIPGFEEEIINHSHAN